MKTPLLLGLGAAVALSLPSALHAQCSTSGSTLTSYLGGNGHAGVMFDMVVGGADMTLECLDVNLRPGAGTYDVEVWYKSGTSVGSELNMAAWTLLKAFPSTTPTGTNLPTTLDMTGSGVIFAAGQTYGVYVHTPTYVVGNGPSYTNGGPTTYTGTHCDIVTNVGMSANWGGTFVYREFNGEAFTDAAGPGLSLSCGGGVATANISGCTPAGPIAVVYGPAGVFVNPQNTCNGLVLDLVPLNNPPLILSADALGAASVTRPVGPGPCGSGILVQAVDIVTCVATNSSAL